MPKGSGETDVRIDVAYDATVYDRIRGGDADPPTSVCLLVGGREVGRGRDHLRWHLGQLVSAASSLLDGDSAVVEFFEESDEFRFEPDGDVVRTWFASDPGPERQELTYPDGTTPDAARADETASESDRPERVAADRRALVEEILSTVETFYDVVAEANPNLAESVTDLRAETQSLRLAAAEFGAWALPVRLLDTVAERSPAGHRTSSGDVPATPVEGAERRRTLVTAGGARIGVHDPDGRAEAAERESRAVARIWLADPTVESAGDVDERRSSAHQTESNDVGVGIDSGADAFEWSGTRFRGEVVSVADGRAVLDVGEGTVAFDPGELPDTDERRSPARRTQFGGVAVGDRLAVRAGRTDLRGLDVVAGPSAGDWSEDRLRDALSDGENRAEAATELARRGVRAAVPDLVETLDGELSVPDRRAVVRALDVLADPRAVDALVARLGDDDDAVRRAAATALSTIGDPDAMDALFDAAESETDEVTRYTIVRAARDVDPTTALNRFAHVLRTGDDPAVRETVVRVLRVTGGERAHGLVLEALDDSDPTVAREAISVVRWGDDERAVPGLLRRLTDDDPLVRQEAAGAFAELGARAEHFQDGEELSEATRERVVEALIEQLDDPVSAVRSWVMEALGAQAHPNAVGPLCAAYDEESELRWNVVAALGRIGDPRAIPTVVAALDDDDPSVRRRACRASARLGTTAAVSPLCDRATADPNADVRREAIDALGRLGGAETRVVEALASVLDDAPAPLRRAAVTALGRMDGPEVRRLLREVAENDPSESVRERARTRLG